MIFINVGDPMIVVSHVRRLKDVHKN